MLARFKDALDIVNTPDVSKYVTDQKLEVTRQLVTLVFQIGAPVHDEALRLFCLALELGRSKGDGLTFLCGKSHSFVRFARTVPMLRFSGICL